MSTTSTAEQEQRPQEHSVRSFEALTDFVDSAAIGMHWVGPDGTILWANPSDYEPLGYSHEEYVGHNIAEFHADPAVISDILARLGRRERLSDYQAVLRCKDGSHRYVSINSSVRADAKGDFLHTRCFTRDVTSLRRTEAALRQSEEQFRALVDNIPELAWSARPDGHIDQYNRRWYDYTGTTFEEMEGWGWEKVHDPAVLPEVKRRWQESLETGQPFEMEFPLRGADGVFRWFLTRIVPLRNSEGNVIRWFGSNTNIDTQRRQAEALREAVQLRDTFLSVASHELKTPLTPVSLRLDAVLRLAEQQPDSEFVRQVRGLADLTKRQLGRLTHLVNDLLDVSRISSGHFRMELEETDLAVLAKEVIARHEPDAAKAGSAILVTAPESLPAYSARLRVEQVISNLVENAIKYGEGKPIRVKLEETDGRVTLSVSDQGIGIPKENLSRIFDRFERAVSERNYGGLGLGLYISRTIVDGLGGSIRVESERSKRSTFTAQFPVRAADVRPVISREELTAALAEFFRVSKEDAAVLVERAQGSTDWEPGPAPGTFLMPVKPGSPLGGGEGVPGAHPEGRDLSRTPSRRRRAHLRLSRRSH